MKEAIYEASHELASLGYKVFPQAPGSQNPLISRLNGGRGPYDGTTDHDVIDRWLSRCPTMNVALHLEGLAVVDIDRRRGGFETMARLTRRHGKLPITPVSATGGKGLHYFYLRPDRAIRQGSDLLGPGVEIKSGPGAAVTVPPSWCKHHGPGNRYAWLRGPTTPLAPLPTWIVGQCLPLPTFDDEPTIDVKIIPNVEERAVAFVARSVEHYPSIQGQNGSRSLAYIARCLVRGFCLDTGTALAMLESTWNPHARPPWSKRELQHAIAYAQQWRGRPRGWLLAEPKGRAA